MEHIEKKQWSAPQLVDLMIEDTLNSLPGNGADGTTANYTAFS